MSRKNPPLASQRKHPLGLGKLIFMLSCLALPVVFYLATGHPAFMVVFLGGMMAVGVTMARPGNK